MRAVRSPSASGRILAFLSLSLPGIALFAGGTVGPNHKRPDMGGDRAKRPPDHNRALSRDCHPS
jgi:hypothetical protein